MPEEPNFRIYFETVLFRFLSFPTSLKLLFIYFCLADYKVHQRDSKGDLKVLVVAVTPLEGTWWWISRSQKLWGTGDGQSFETGF